VSRSPIWKLASSLPLAHGQLQQLGVLVVGVQLLEVLHKALDAEKALLEVHRHDLVALLAFVQAVQRKHVLDARLLLQAHEDVVAEQQVPAHLGEVAAQAIVLGAHTHAPDDFHLAAAKLLQPLFVELAHQGFQRLALGIEPLGQNFIRAAAGDGLIDRGGGLEFGGRGVFGHGIQWLSLKASRSGRNAHSLPALDSPRSTPASEGGIGQHRAPTPRCSVRAAGPCCRR